MAEKLKMTSNNIIQENIEYIASKFPNALKEVMEDGKLVKKIDFDVLKQELSTVVIDDKQERYQMTWPDKKKSILLANSRINATLRPCKEKSVDFDNTKNLYIEGDNLDVLKLLRETYLGKVKMIYIDPPYNTGNDFVYNDDFAQSSEEYLANSGQFDNQGNRMVTNNESNGRFHTDWLNMMYPRLKVARDLLTDDGVIFISVDDNEVENLRKICEEIFSEINLVAQIPWQSRASIQNDTDFSVNHEYICVFAKTRRLTNRRLKETNYSEWIKRDSFVCKPLPLDDSKFSNPDNDPRGPWKADPMDAPNIRPNLTYPITNPNTGVQHLPPAGRCWRISQDKFFSALADSRIVWTNNGTGRPQLKSFYNEKKDYGSIDNSWFSAERIGTSTNGTKELMALFNGKSYFDTPKPTSLMNKLLFLANMHDGDVVLDFFSGSATTADACMSFCKSNKISIDFIMVQIPERISSDSLAYKDGYKTICDIGEERIRRAGKKIKEENSLFADPVDTGFRVLKLDSSNMHDVYYNPKSFSQSLLEETVDNIKSDRTPLDLLFQVMIELGIELSSKIEEKEINGKKYYLVNDNNLIACFDDDLSNDVLIEIAKLQPLYAVFKDKSFSNDSVGINNEQIFKTYSQGTIIKVL